MVSPRFPNRRLCAMMEIEDPIKHEAREDQDEDYHFWPGLGKKSFSCSVLQRALKRSSEKYPSTQASYTLPEGTKKLPGVGQFWTPMVGQISKPIDIKCWIHILKQGALINVIRSEDVARQSGFRQYIDDAITPGKGLAYYGDEEFL